MKNIVTIGGGTGSFVLLTGLKKYTKNLTAIVAMSDSGGSTGVLRDELGILPPGDIRRCLIALSQSPKILLDLFNYRFHNGHLAGHSFGNLFLAALSEITGDFEKAITKASEILKIEGRVIPVTLTKTTLYAQLENGRVIEGEQNIDIPKHNPKLKIKNIFLKPPAKSNPRALEAIRKADLIVIGPGDIYTSIIPNLLVNGTAKAIRNSRAKKIYVNNLMTKYGESNDFKVHNFIEEIEKYLGKNVIDYVIFNNKRPPKRLLAKYEKEKKYFVEWDEEKLKNKHYLAVPANVISGKNLVRHDPDKLAKIILTVSELENVFKIYKK